MTPGTLIAGKYRLRRPLGTGAMGAVWAAVNELTEREVALKLLQSQDPELRRRLLREAKACGRLSHRNIVEIYDVGEASEGDPFLVMELLKGESLADRLRRERSISSVEAVKIAIDIAKALRAAHEAGVVHRDLKPANIFLAQVVDDEGEMITRVKVLDFGVSKLAIENETTATTPGSMLGSPAYMSPEQARASVVDSRTDLWSLGMVLFEMISGERPFQSRTLASVIADIVSTPIPTLESRVRGLDPALSHVVARCLERGLEYRVQSAEELIGLLRPFAAAAREPPPQRGPSDSQRPTQEFHPRALNFQASAAPIPAAPRLPEMMRGATATSSTTPVSHGDPRPPMETTDHSQRPSRRPIGLMVGAGALLSVVVAAGVVLTVVRGHREDNAAVSSAVPILTAVAPSSTPSAVSPVPTIAVVSDNVPAPEDTGPIKLGPLPKVAPSGTASAGESPAAETATLNFNSIPVSKVLLDGKPLGSTPKVGVSVRPGEHTVTFIHPDQGKKTIVVQVKSGDNKVAAVRFP